MKSFCFLSGDHLTIWPSGQLVKSFDTLFRMLKQHLMRQKMPHYFIRWFTSSQTCILVFTPQQVEHVRRHSKPQAEANSGKGRPPLMLNSMNSMKNHQFHFRSIQGASNQREPSPLPAEQHIQVETRKGVGASP